mmetsp:Transcript_45418/g.131089  ORF Transcript_45418/g.131089 Transcript_45418/m.131089 type:complete len:200 (-) Transcript_45418:20-619(-)
MKSNPPSEKRPFGELRRANAPGPWSPCTPRRPSTFTTVLMLPEARSTKRTRCPPVVTKSSCEESLYARPAGLKTLEPQAGTPFSALSTARSATPASVWMAFAPSTTSTHRTALFPLSATKSRAPASSQARPLGVLRIPGRPSSPAVTMRGTAHPTDANVPFPAISNLFRTGSIASAMTRPPGKSRKRACAAYRASPESA